MIEKNIALNYLREVVNKTIYTLNWVQIKKGTNATPFELWYDHSPNVKHVKAFGCKCYILKESRNGKFDEHVEFKIKNPSRNQKNTNPLYTSMKECLMKKMLQIKLGINRKFQYFPGHDQWMPSCRMKEMHILILKSAHMKEMKSYLIEMCIVTLMLKDKT